MGKIATLEYFRVPPRWLFVKITDEAGNIGWGEASLEGHTQSVEGCLDAWFKRYRGFEAEYVCTLPIPRQSPLLLIQSNPIVTSNTSGRCLGVPVSTAEDRCS